MLLRLFAMLVVISLASAASAHHIWILPDAPAGKAIRVVFSDYLQPDKDGTLHKIEHTRLWTRDVASHEAAVTWKKAGPTFVLDNLEFDATARAPLTIGGRCVYGIETYDHREWKRVAPYLLVYYPKAIIGPPSSGEPWQKLELEIMAKVKGDEVQLQVLFRGRPAPHAELYAHPPVGKRIALETNDQGIVHYRIADGGVHGFRTRTIEQQVGEHSGQDYGEVRHYASLVLFLDQPAKTN